jgi:site-specific DNA recombinase
LNLAFGFIRRSSYKQQENNSVEIQKQHIKEFAQRNQLIVPDEFIIIEDVTSAFSKKADQRKHLIHLGEKMTEMKVSTVIFHDISRMDRTGYSFTIDFYRPLLEKLPELKVYTTKSNDPIDPDDPDIKMNFLLFQHESEIKSERAISNLTSDLQTPELFRPGAKIPYGYSQINKQLVLNDNADIVRFIYFLSSWGQSLQKIASVLNAADIPSPSGGIWRPSTIENILKNPVYTGKLVWNIYKRKDDGQRHYVFDEAHPAVIDEIHKPLFYFNLILQKNYGRFDTPFLFLNKAKCMKCNEHLTTQNGSTKRNGVKYHYKYYVCKACNYKFNCEEVHTAFLPVILKKVQSNVSTNSYEIDTLDTLVAMNEEVELNIRKIRTFLPKLDQKLKAAININDRELELKILDFIALRKEALNSYSITQKALRDIHQMVDSNQFFNRFDEILDHQLGTDEKRLIILYFVDHLLFSPDHKPQIIFKSNIFSDISNSSTFGWITEQP